MPLLKPLAVLSPTLEGGPSRFLNCPTIRHFPNPPPPPNSTLLTGPASLASYLFNPSFSSDLGENIYVCSSPLNSLRCSPFRSFFFRSGIYPPLRSGFYKTACRTILIVSPFRAFSSLYCTIRTNSYFFSFGAWGRVMIHSGVLGL